MKREVEPIANAREPTRRAVSLQVKLLLAICLLPSLSMLTLFGDPKPWGDENYYLGYVAALCDSPWHSLLPGRLLFDWWPLFYQQLTAQFASCQGLPDGLREATATYREALTALPGPHPTLLVAVSGFELVPGGQWKADLFARLSLMNYGLFLLSGGLVYRLARLLGCREWVGAVACGTYWINPRIFFYLGTLWPEVLHGFLLLVFMVSLGTALQEDRLALPHRLLLAVLAGLAGAAALFTKGVMGPYLWLLMAGGLGGFAWRLAARRIATGDGSFAQAGQPAGRTAVGAYTLSVLMLALVSALGLAQIQKLANAQRYAVPLLAANTWINLEQGLKFADENALKGELLFREYLSNPNFLERESVSKDRILAYLSETLLQSPGAFASRQLTKLFERRLWSNYWERALRLQRWRAAPNLQWVFVWVARVLSAGLLAASCLYLFSFRNWNATGWLLGSFLLYYLAVQTAVIGNPRVVAQLMPVAPLAAAYLLERRLDQRAQGSA